MAKNDSDYYLKHPYLVKEEEREKERKRERKEHTLRS